MDHGRLNAAPRRQTPRSFVCAPGERSIERSAQNRLEGGSMSHDSADGLKGTTIERRTFLQLAGGAALAGATQWASTAAAAPSKPYVPGSSTNEYDKMFVAAVTPYTPGTEDIDEVAFRNYMRYWAQPKFIGAGGAMLVSPEA